MKMIEENEEQNLILISKEIQSKRWHSECKNRDWDQEEIRSI